MAQELKVMVGIPASGKSTWTKHEAKRLEEDGKSYTIISRDAIRKDMLKPGEDYFARENEVFGEFIKRINASLQAGIEVVIADATHVSAPSRRKLLNRISPPEGTRLTFEVMTISLKEAKERNAKREGFAKIPNSALESMNRGFSYPEEDEFPPSKWGFKDIEVIVHRKKG